MSQLTPIQIGADRLIALLRNEAGWWEGDPNARQVIIPVLESAVSHRQALTELVAARREYDKWYDWEAPGRNPEQVQAARQRLDRAWEKAKAVIETADQRNLSET